MREDILESLQKEVYDRCLKPTNKFGMGCYDHIRAVVKNAAQHLGNCLSSIGHVTAVKMNQRKED